jgi:hypothetical protein
MDENSSSETRGKPIRCRGNSSSVHLKLISYTFLEVSETVSKCFILAAVTRKPAEPLVIEEIIVAPPWLVRFGFESYAPPSVTAMSLSGK